MAISTGIITFDLADLGGEPVNPSRTKVWATTNINGGAIIDPTGNEIRLGDGRGTVNDDGTGSITVPVPFTGSSPASWQTYIHVEFRTAREIVTRTFGPFTVTGNTDLADLIPEQDIPPNYADGVLAEMAAIRDEVRGIAVAQPSQADRTVVTQTLGTSPFTFTSPAGWVTQLSVTGGAGVSISVNAGGGSQTYIGGTGTSIILTPGETASVAWTTIPTAIRTRRILSI